MKKASGTHHTLLEGRGVRLYCNSVYCTVKKENLKGRIHTSNTFYFLKKPHTQSPQIFHLQSHKCAVLIKETVMYVSVNIKYKEERC